MYKEVTSNPDFPSIERKILELWKKNNIFIQSIKQREGKAEFIFYDGPPFANGLPHYGHLLTGFIKDLYARYQTTKGKKVERRFGWDCHGLPAEMAAEKELNISGQKNITEFGIDKFNDHCRISVMKYSELWEEYVTRQARWVNFVDSYKTMDINFMESVLWAFKELYKKGFIYQAMKVMPYSFACQTPLSNFETRLDNSYRERSDKAVTVAFTLKQAPQEAQKILGEGYEYKILVWTTTPWTLPSNLALAVGKEIEYSFVAIKNKKICYILATSSLKQYEKELGENKDNILNQEDIILKLKGSDLLNIEYKPLFNYFINHPNSFKILAGDFVVEGDGTAIVHLAPGFGEDDQILCENNNIHVVCPVDNAGCFTKEVKDFEGLNVIEANDKIIQKLKELGQWIKTEQYLHNYPHCWRTDTPLIYKAVPSWYVKVTAFKDRMIELNKQINWVPTHIKDGLFGKWLENAKDWSISRNRFWGAPIPVWVSDNPQYPRIDVYGSIKELEEDFKVKITSLHRPDIDKLVRPNPDDKTGKSMMKRVGDVFDCWFESGSMPYGQAHYPFKNKEWFEKNFPADFIVEYSAQTRGWFYTLMVLSTALFDKPPFLNCICHGVILDTAGQKLSKRLNNYTDPLEIFNLYGADALRVTMLSSPVVKGQELLIDKEGKMVYDSLRLFLKPIWNSYHFFTLYANADKIKANYLFAQKDPFANLDNDLDKYILIKLKYTVQDIENSLDNFDTQKPYKAVQDFFEILNNWYIRRSRDRFWQSHYDQNKQNAYDVLYSCLRVISIAASSLIPLISEEVYLGLLADQNDSKSSVHLEDFPNLDIVKDDKNLVILMDKILEICSTSLFIRSTHNIRVRQPLSSLTIIGKNNLNIDRFSSLIKDEINVKNIYYNENIENFASRKLSINFPLVGKRIPHKVKDIIKASKQGDWKLEGEDLVLAGEKLQSGEFSLLLEPHENIIGAKPMPDQENLLYLDLNVTGELLIEGGARDLVRFIAQARKEAGLNIADRILLSIDFIGDLQEKDILELNFSEIMDNYKDFIEQQTLSSYKKDLEGRIDYRISFPLEKKEIVIKLRKFD